MSPSGENLALVSVSFESFASKIEAQRHRQMQTKGWRDVDFDVRIEEGKVRLVGKPVRAGDGER